MWVEAIVTREDLAGLLAEILPVKIHFDSDDATERWLQLHRATEVTLIPDEGLRVVCAAELRWSIAGMSPAIVIDDLAVLLRPDIVERKGGHVLEFNLQIEEADVRGVPALIDSTIVKVVNSALASKKLDWNFTETLTRKVGLGKTLEPIEALTIESAWGKRRISAEALVLAVSFKLGFVRTDEPGIVARYAMRARDEARPRGKMDSDALMQ